MARRGWRCTTRKDTGDVTLIRPETNVNAPFLIRVAAATHQYDKSTAVTPTMLTLYHNMRWAGGQYIHDPTQDVTLIWHHGTKGYHRLTKDMRERLLKGDPDRAVTVVNESGAVLDVMSTYERNQYRKQLLEEAMASAERAKRAYENIKRKSKLSKSPDLPLRKKKKGGGGIRSRFSWVGDMSQLDRDDDAEAGGKFVSPDVLIIPDL